MDLEIYALVIPAIGQNEVAQFNISLLNIDKNGSQTFVFKVREREIELFFGTKKDITTGIVYQTIKKILPFIDSEDLKICIYTTLEGIFN